MLEQRLQRRHVGSLDDERRLAQRQQHHVQHGDNGAVARRHVPVDAGDHNGHHRGTERAVGKKKQQGDFFQMLGGGAGNGITRKQKKLAFSSAKIGRRGLVSYFFFHNFFFIVFHSPSTDVVQNPGGTRETADKSDKGGSLW